MEGLPKTSHAHEKRSSGHDTATDVRSPKRRRRATKALLPKSYTIAWICALHIELAAARAMLDEIHPDVPRDKGDKNVYVLGSIGKYNVVIACLPEGHYGTINAGRVLADLRRTFTEIWAGFMVGIGGGAPSDRNDIRLGDVVVGTRVMPYELGKILAGGEIERTAIQKAPDFLLCSLVSKVRAVAESDQERSRILSIVEERFADMPDFGRPDDPDLLFHAAYPHDENSLMDTCSRCDQSKLVPRRQRNTKGPTMHYGGIASGDKVVKDGLSRDRLAETLRVLCFEMEAAGLMDTLACLPIRGVCDYADSHKRKGWQKFAAANAAAYARLLLETLSDGTYEPSEPGPSASQMHQYKVFKDSLYFAHIFSRRDTIKAAHAKTCRWILEDPRFKKWNVSREDCHQHGFLWIAGKPGAGKSTLMKFLSGTKTMRPRKKHLTATFFFHARGHVLEKSISGMYRSLVLQLLEGFTDLQAIIHNSPIALDGYSCCPSNEKLKDILKDCILRLGKRTFTCFIDALDEGDEQQIIEMVRYFEDLAEEATRKKVLLRICFSSRHYPYIDIRHGTRLTLEDQAGHTEDMINYVKGHLRVHSPAPVADLHSELLRRSSGVFLWIVLVVDILNKEGRRGGFSIMTRLKEIPGDLRDLFADMLTRDQDNMHDLRLCIMWILFAKRPLTPAEFYHAMWSSLLAKGLADEDPPDPASKAFKIGARLSVINSSKGLAGVTTSDTPVVQFIHESVRDFLLKDNGLATIWPDFGEVQSHEIIKESCISYIQRAGDREEIDKVRNAQRLPLLKYCSDFVFIHSEAAAESLSQGDFLSSFPIQKWVRVHNLFRGRGKYLHETSSRLVYLLAEMALPRLLRTRVKQRLETTGKGAERYKYPFFAAFASGSRATLAALLELSLSDLANMSEAIDKLGFNFEQRTPLTWAISHGLVNLAMHLVRQGASLTESDPGHRTPLRMAIKVKEISLIEHFLGREGSTGSERPRNDAAAISARDQKATSHIAALLGLGPLEARKPLCSFEALEEPIVVRRLLEAGASLRDRGVRGNTPMGVASAHGFEETLELLIEAGGDINDDRDHEGRTPLFHAAVNGHQSTIELLIRSGARIRAQDKFKPGLNMRDASGSVPLHRALQNGRQQLAKLLIDFGADLNACSRGGSRPLHFALMNGQESVAKYLVDHGADLNAGNLNGEIPLHWAVERGVLETAEMFINHEDDNVNLPDNSGLTPLHKAVASPRCNVAVVSFLLRYGADVAAKTKTGLTPLHLCASNRLSAITMTLLKHGAETDARDNRGLTPLYFAARAMDFPMTGLLRQHGADVNARNGEGSTLLHFASSEGDGTTAVTLINHGADINARNNRGSTPLHVAAQGGKKEAARALINHGGDINSRDIRGRTPGDIADRSIAHLFAA